MQGDVAEAALSAVVDLGHALDVADLAAGDVDQLQRAALLGDQQAAVGQEGHRPRLVESGDFGAGEGAGVAGGRFGGGLGCGLGLVRSEEHTSELQSLMRISYAVFCLKKKK